MTYTALLHLNSEEEYRIEWEKQYCQAPILTFDNISVRFKKEDFYHALFDSIYNQKDSFSKKRAERMLWIKEALQDSSSEQYVGWNSIKKIRMPNRKVILVNENYVVVIDVLQKKPDHAKFITAYVGDGKYGKRSTIELIRTNPSWSSLATKKTR